MDGLIFPIIMLAVTLLGGGFLLVVLKRSKPKHRGGGEGLAIQTAQEFINVRDIWDKYLYTTDGLILAFVRIHSISIDLYSRAEKNSLIRQLTAELSDIQYPFKFLAVSRPVDISPVITDMQSMLKEADDRRKELLRQEILQMSGFALSGEIVERQFYVSLWEKAEEGAEKELLKRAALFSEKFSGCGIPCDVLGEKEIVRLLNLVHNPSYTHLEDTEFFAAIPTLEYERQGSI
ncbi:MAG: hypothetical protein HFH85_15310 [Lachnospiraceae bacterium]|jgi:hypothetical protein|nr:hypothetical protein [Lachnospiraceae bacterium]